MVSRMIDYALNRSEANSVIEDNGWFDDWCGHAREPLCAPAYEPHVPMHAPMHEQPLPDTVPHMLPDSVPDLLRGPLTESAEDMDDDLSAEDDDYEPFDLVTHPLITCTDLPGPLSMKRLSVNGAVRTLDHTNAYSTEQAGTLYGRARIVQQLIPFGTTACSMTALWIWLGGAFPKTVDVLSSSHYRAMSHGRRIRVFNRKTQSDHLVNIGEMSSTSPIRTACDIAMLMPGEVCEQDVCEILCALMEEYKFKPDECLSLLESNPFWPNTQAAKELFTAIRHFF